MMRVETHNPNKPNLVRLVYEGPNDMHLTSQQIDTDDIRQTAAHLNAFSQILMQHYVRVPCGSIRVKEQAGI